MDTDVKAQIEQEIANLAHMARNSEAKCKRLRRIPDFNRVGQEKARIHWYGALQMDALKFLTIRQDG